MRSRTGPVAALLFTSGFCALVYQVSWLREFRLIFGASTLASAAVLAIFIGGLGVGGLLLGPRADRHGRPLLFYATLEASVAVFAALTPALLMLARAVYLASGGSGRLGLTAATVERLLLSVVVLAVPTIAMGGTLPAAARFVTRDGDVRRQDLATLYALNTLGAVAGCVIATFFLLEIYGTRATIWLAAALNILVAVMARTVDRQATPADLPARLDRPDPHDLSISPDLPDLPAFLLLASGTVGFAFFLMELVWYRLLSPLLGGSVFTFGLVLAVALVGIGAGGLFYSLISSERPATLGGFAATCLLEATAVALTFALGDRIALLALALLPLGAAGFATTVACWALITGIVVLPPALIAGYQFPLLIALFGHGRNRVGRDVGLAYAANTAGAIVGSLAGGFGVMPWLSAPGTWRLVALVLVLLGIGAVVLDVLARKARGSRHARVFVSVVLSAVALLLLTATGPTTVWRHSGIGAGRAPKDVFNSPNQLRAWEQFGRRAIVWDGDGVESTVALAVETNGYAFIVNGKSDGSARGDAGTQVMLGLLGALNHPQPKRALVVGLGTGSSAGWLGAVPTMERVDVVELEPLVLEVAKASEAVNHGVLKNPRVHVTIADARETLLTTNDRFDVIASEPSNPFRAGIASLFTVEFYRAARERLTDNGVFAQWVQGYEIDARTLRTIYATLAGVFPQVETWQTNHGDLVLIASTRPAAHHAAALRARIAEEPFKSAIANTWRATSLQGMFAHYLANDRFARAMAGAPHADVNTDDRNIVEFGLARSVGRAMPSLVAEVRNLARALDASRPPLDSDAGISWPAVDTAWGDFVGWDLPTPPPTGMPPEELRRQQALRYYHVDVNPTAAREIWRQLTEGPRDPMELAMAADIEADAGAETALPLIEQLRAYQPAEADVVLATLRLRQSRPDEAAAALVSALTRLRTDPWAQIRFVQKALVLAEGIAEKNPALARPLFDALKQPFSVQAADTPRLVTRVDLAVRFDLRGACQSAFGDLEPYIPWTRALLIMRRDCYQQMSDPRLPNALRDLDAFASREPIALAPQR